MTLISIYNKRHSCLSLQQKPRGVFALQLARRLHKIHYFSVVYYNSTQIKRHVVLQDVSLINEWERRVGGFWLLLRNLLHNTELFYKVVISLFVDFERCSMTRSLGERYQTGDVFPFSAIARSHRAIFAVSITIVIYNPV